MDQFSLDKNKRLEAYEHLIEMKKKNGLYKEFHALQFELLNYLFSQKNWQKLESISMSLAKDYPNYFNYTYFYYLSLAEFNKIETLNNSFIELCDDILFQGKKFEDFKGSNIQLFDLISEISVTPSGDYQTYKWELVTTLTKSLLVKEAPTKKEFKYIQNLLLLDQSAKVFRICVYAFAAWGSRDLFYQYYLHGIKNKFLDFIFLTKNNIWIKEIIKDHDHTDLLKISPSLESLEAQSKPLVFKKVAHVSAKPDEFIDESPIIMSFKLAPPPVENIPDLILAYQMMSFNNVVQELISYAHSCKLTPDLLEKIKYMELNFYLHQKDYLLALSVSSELRSMNLNQEKLLEINYIEATVLSKLNRPDEALRKFKQIMLVNQNYRQTVERMKEIEKG